MPESKINHFGRWIVREDWECVDPADNPSYQAKMLQDRLLLKLDEIFPTKCVRLSKKDKKYNVMGSMYCVAHFIL